MDSLTCLDSNRLCIGKTLAAHDIVATHHANKFIIFDISMNSLCGLRTSRLRIDDKGTVETVRLLLRIVVMTMIPVRTDILVRHCEIVDISLSRLNRVLSQ